MKRILFLTLLSVLNVSVTLNAATPKVQPTRKLTIVGGGIIGALEAYYAYQEAKKEGVKLLITMYDKNKSLTTKDAVNNTAYNIVPSFTPDEILSVVPRGNELTEKLAILFSKPGGIRVDDVPGVNDSPSALNFKDAVAAYGSDKNHDDRTLTLLQLGKKSMDLWQQMYDEGDQELKSILEAANFHPCHEPKNGSKNVLHDGYRVDIIYGFDNPEARALGMKADYEKLGYQFCAILTPDEVIAIDPFLADFCYEHSVVDANNTRVWQKDSIALWRPGGCIDARIFFPKFYSYLKKSMGQYEEKKGIKVDCFNLQFNKEVTGVKLDSSKKEMRVVGLKFKDGTSVSDQESEYVFCPGEAVGTLQHLGFQEPTYAAFAGASLMMNIPLNGEQIEMYKTFSHCMEVHNVGIVLAWQARFKDNGIFIGVAGTKAFYGDKQPNKTEEFSRNRNLVQLNMINQVLPEFISIACGYDTHGKTLTADDLTALEDKGIANRWVGRRAVAYDGFPTFGPLYKNNKRVVNARCTTHMGSGGVSFAPGAVFMSRSSLKSSNDALTQKVLTYADSRRSAK